MGMCGAGDGWDGWEGGGGGYGSASVRAVQSRTMTVMCSAPAHVVKRNTHARTVSSMLKGGGGKAAKKIQKVGNTPRKKVPKMSQQKRPNLDLTSPILATEFSM